MNKFKKISLGLTLAATLVLGPGIAQAKKAPPARITLAQVGASNLGQYVTVRGRIIREDTFSAGWRLWIQDETAVAILHIQEPDYPGIVNPRAIANGAVVQFTGPARLVLNGGAR